MTDGEELLKHKERVDVLYRDVKKNCEIIQGLCNEILFIHDPSSHENNISGVEDITEILLYHIGKKVNEHLNRTRFLLDAYEEYSEILNRRTSME